MKMKTPKQLLAESLKDPKFKKAYDALQFEFDIIKALLDYRIKKGLGQKELADTLKISHYSLNKFMHDPDTSRLSFLKKVTVGLGLKLSVK